MPDCEWQTYYPHYASPAGLLTIQYLLNQLFRCCVTRAMLKHAKRQGLEIGIFCALHTYGRQLNQHPHIHLSVTRGDSPI
ncbi:transposase (plasmid) [Arsenophonus nasoniae]|uniref:Transposase n=1 Tax=Arsenophonus nasoniae TaxID=638 RepID=A0AA95KFK4_9GAMM|nr:transposase [Arsenophonus nasoniae]WGM03969.1 transposase [Arsenophonus nasoniae]